MRKSLNAVAFAVSLLLGDMAGAVPVGTRFDFFMSEGGPPGALSVWRLSLSAEAPVAAIGITAPDTTTFMINPLVLWIAPFGSGSSFTQAATPGLFSLNLNPSTCAGINCTPFVNAGATVELGSFTAPAGPSLPLGSDDDSVGGTVFDAQLVPYNVSCSGGSGHGLSFLNCVVVPEPAPLALLALLALALALRRVRVTQKSLATAAAAVCLLAASGAAAVPIGTRFTFVEEYASYSPLAINLYLTTEFPVGAIGVTAPDDVTFTINAANSNIAAFGSGSSFNQAATPGRFSLNLNPTTCIGINCVPFATSSTTLLGTFNLPTYRQYVIEPDDDSVGGTIFDAQLSPYNVACARDSDGGGPLPFLICTVVPEPGTPALLALVLAAVSLRARSR